MDEDQNSFDIQEYMTHGVERVVREAMRATLKNPRESIYMAKFAAASKAASKKRRKAEDALRGLLFQVQSCYSGCGSGQAINKRRMA